ncbi:hypothetical protein JHK85_057838 [Glycine max]|nr:hypothetical protein JHK85_057838 [Glycine max]
MSLSNGDDSTVTSKQQKPQLPNPFDLTDSEILEKVYLTHLHDDDRCDVEVLSDIVSTVVLKIITTPRGERYVHQTTMCILQHLRSYSWEAKALVTLAAFALEYGNLLHLSDVATPEKQLTNSLKQLNQVEARKKPATTLVELVMEVLHGIQEWTRLSGLDYDIVEVPSLTEAQQEVPVVVYWIIASLVAATANLVGLSLDKIEDEISLLNSIHDRLHENPNEVVKNYKKGDFKILWIPIVDAWDVQAKTQVQYLEGYHQMVRSGVLH